MTGNEMLESIRASLRGYPNCGGDVEVINEVERIVAERTKDIKDAAEMLWVVLANVSGGDWSKQSEDWQNYAARWRDNYFKAIQ